MSIWEIAVKSRLGKLKANVDEIVAALPKAGLQSLDFTVDDAAEVAKLPSLHRDPFDRALVAQARRGDLQLLTVDTALLEYGEHVLLAGTL